ncbi:hypothetical protein [Undibacterium sp. Ren11W]|uniref:hypothetical protein n=1 Tax=Undibacterium sp. Ren11W TaxID=3413045 RepID=UPI003BF08C0A
MKIAQISEAANNHILLGEAIASVKRLVKAWQIWRIDSQYRALGDYVQELQVNQFDAERARIALLIRRADIRAAMRNLGGQ